MSDDKDPQRISDAADNCEVLRARLAKYEDDLGNPIGQEPIGAVDGVVATAPARIFLIIGAECPRDAQFADLSEVSWCEDDLDNGIPYVRADLSALKAQTSALDYLAVINKAYMALTGYLPGHRNAITDEAIEACRSALNSSPVSGGGVDELADSVRVLLEVSQLRGEQAYGVQPIIDRVRAALSAPSHGEQVRDRYTCTGKGGDYQLLGLAQGAGTLNGLNYMVYRNVDGVMFVREPEDFLARMEMLAAAPSAGSQQGGDV